jgi:glycosyltransferase involved in cell wall biosynthesis
MKKKIYFVHTGLATFVKTDLDILSKEYDVNSYHYNISSTSLGKIKNVLFSLWYSFIEVPKCDVVYVWFGGYHGFFPVFFAKLLGKKSIVIVGGYDASYVPSIQYGVFYTKGPLLWCIKKVYKWASYVCPVDESLVKSTNFYADRTGVGYPTGILNHMNLDEKKIKVIHLGFDIDRFLVGEKSNKSVVSIASAFNYSTFQLKGIDLIVQIAISMPDVHFTIMGVKESLFREIPKNMMVISVPKYVEIIQKLSTSSVVLHCSRTEGFNATIPEGMLCGCIPVGSNVGGIKRSIGECGYVIDKADKEAYIEAIKRAISQGITLGQQARLRARSLYSLERRTDAMMAIIQD